MRPVPSTSKAVILFILLAMLSPGCLPGRQPEERIDISIEADEQVVQLSIPAGSTVFDALELASIVLGTYDRVDPPSYTVLKEGMHVVVTRVQETIIVENEVVPFEQQVIRNEVLSEGEQRLLQAGQNGLAEITYRLVEEENEAPYQIVLNRVVVTEPIPEILMIGARASFVPASFSGSISYASAGNLWYIDGESGNRSPLLLTGDVDGRVLQFSSDGHWLLFSRGSENTEESINSLWAIQAGTPNPDPIDLSVSNVVHFADWEPFDPQGDGTYTLAYSSVEPRPFAPGWQANNDLVLLTIDSAGKIIRRRKILESNPGGQYGWWGTNFSWSPNSERIAYARADGIGIVEVASGDLEPLVTLTPYQTFGDWAWVPFVDWSPDSQILFYVEHGKPLSLESAEASQVFHLNAIPLSSGYTLSLVSRVGMFSTFAPSPPTLLPNGESEYVLAFLQAIFPLDSERSRYQLVLIDRDGSNRDTLFPPEGELGIEPGRIVWSPDGEKLAIIYRDDLWLIDPWNDLYQQLTADGQTIAFDWSP